MAVVAGATVTEVRVRNYTKTILFFCVSSKGSMKILVETCVKPVLIALCVAATYNALVFVVSEGGGRSLLT